MDSSSARLSRGIDVISPRVYGWRGRANSAFADASSTLRPAYITTTRCAVSAIDAKVVRDQHDGRARAFLHFQHQVEDLRLDGHVERRRRLVGDEDRRRACHRDRDHDALAHAAGQLVRIFAGAPAGLRDSHQREHLDRPVHGRATRGRRWCSATVSAIWRPTVITGLRLVIGSWKIIDIRLPRIARIAAGSSASSSSPSNRMLPETMRPGRPRNQPHDGQRGDRLAAAALADDPQRLASLERQRQAVHRLDHAVAREEMRGEIVDGKNRRIHDEVTCSARGADPACRAIRRRRD